MFSGWGCSARPRRFCRWADMAMAGWAPPGAPPPVPHAARAAPAERARQPVDAVLRAPEDQRGGDRLLDQEPAQRADLIFFHDFEVVLLDRLYGRHRRVDAHPDGPAGPQRYAGGGAAR